ncbi:MAG: protein kinase [Candidatus Latescibacterota bacterium]|nr:MAG: protein kinase [Candidatus Latescibacterota bacterium]
MMIGKTISHYKILEKLGEGGMGVVYKAEDLNLKRVVALKFLPPDLTRDAEAKERFKQEAQAASALDHSNICTIHEIDETDDGQIFICMTCYEGETLKERIGKGPLPIKDAVGMATQIAQGLGKAHAKDIVHRDVKPANIFVTDDNEVKIFDFGLAKLTGQTRLTKAGTTLGTVAYMSPEQTSGSDVDHRSDIWALGVVLYEMVAGKLPFTGDHEQAVMYSIVNREPEPLTALRTGVPMELDQIVTKCLEKSPADRYQRIEEVVVDLNRQTRRMQEPLDAPSRRPAGIAKKRKSIDRWVGVVLAVMACAVIAYAIYWQLSLPEKKKVAVPASEKPMLVVLPFENLGPSDVEYFADGVTEEITSRLAALSELGVISRTSAFQYKGMKVSVRQIGEELGVDYVLEGTVRWDKPEQGESRVRVTPQLIRVADDTYLWSDRYDRVLEDIFAVQTEIATHVIEQLNITLLEPERQTVEAKPTDNMEAYQAYLRGREYAARPMYSPQLSQLAIQMFERAVELDPDFALAYAALGRANSYVFNVGVDRTQNRMARAKAAVDRALELQPELPEAYLALGYYYYHCLRDFDRALEAFDTAGKRLPNQNEVLQHIGWIRRRQARWDEALDHHKRSLELNPRDPNLHFELGITHLYLRNYEEAEAYLDQSIALAPDEVWGYAFKAVIYWLKSGDLERARATLERTPETNEPFLQFLWFFQEIFERDYPAAQNRLAAVTAEFIELPDMSLTKEQLAGRLYRLMGERDRARVSFESARELLEREVAKRPDDGRVHSSLGMVYAALGQREDAIREAKLAMEMIPVSVDAMLGPRQVDHLAWVYRTLGEYEAALDQIEYVLSVPAMISTPYLRIDPGWDSLRDNPRFQRILEKYSGENP